MHIYSGDNSNKISCLRDYMYLAGSHDYVDIAKGQFFKQCQQPNKATVLWTVMNL